LPIPEKCRGRQQKIYPVKFEDYFTGMKGNEKNQASKSIGKNARSLWVEMENPGLKIARISGLRNY
jgi:hypothetical protein